MKKKYQTDPILEAVFELRAKQENSFDLTIPGLLYGKINTIFPIKEPRIVQEFKLLQGPEGLKQQARNIEKMFFFTEDRLQFIQIGSDSLGIGCTKPYPTWPIFRKNIIHAFEELSSLVEIGSPERLGMRYINNIYIPSTVVNLDEYFEFNPHLGEKLPQEITGFTMMAELPFEENRDLCRMQLYMAPPEKPMMSSYILDLDYIMAKSGSVENKDIVRWIDDAHSKLLRLFEGCITSKLIDIFGAPEGNE
jgi:uncharacterized protein (TIGR04255 family)